MDPAAGDVRFASQNALDERPLLNEFPQWLFDIADEREGRGNQAVPVAGEVFEIGWADDAPALCVSAGAFEVRVDIQGAVIVGKLLSGFDVAHRDFQIQTRRN